MVMYLYPYATYLMSMTLEKGKSGNSIKDFVEQFRKNMFIKEALEYWNLCWFQNGDDVYTFCFPTFNGEEAYEEIPAPTEENFLGYVWEA